MMIPVDPPETTSEKNVRMKGLLKLFIGAAGVAAGIVVMMYVAETYMMVLGHGWVAMLGVAGAYGLTGLMQLITGMPFSQMARRWDQIPSVQKFFLGLLIFAAAMGVLAWVIVTFFVNPY
ncbi:hypothetical protein [Brevifollis gellanilyticus]|uniref:Uncharacterized protein n=1 Tax=Brevifollis gellanilyticus TaxID=748831 RepID=A0A512MB77_9BACT|nr:hypothetical protein [Brevifollis gellanilyticus]GEP43984.1 hypothetical protein BGE01nite_32750 [Brevifollis gellanilyticus]